ncbi:MAG TPA: hypothetical protein VGQ20_06895 [Acidimicrobiales bacterium]|jgi:hypothetical protein|nr:hypothetical protein [Acidimicrobiales bacterium]
MNATTFTDTQARWGSNNPEGVLSRQLDLLEHTQDALVDATKAWFDMAVELFPIAAPRDEGGRAGFDVINLEAGAAKFDDVVDAAEGVCHRLQELQNEYVSATLTLPRSLIEAADAGSRAVLSTVGSLTNAWLTACRYGQRWLVESSRPSTPAEEPRPSAPSQP